MKDQQLHWTVLPAGPGSDPDHLAVSVVAAPRLRTDEGNTLAEFPDFADWPALIAASSFVLVLDGGPEIPATRIGELNSAWWSALFPADTPLVPYAFDDYADRPMVTFSHAEVAQQVRTLYAETAALSADALLPLTGPGGLAELRSVRRWREVVDRSLFPAAAGDRETVIARLLQDARDTASLLRATGERGGPLIEPLPAADPTRELERLLLFHARDGRPPIPLPDGDRYEAEFDFHQMISSLGDHPWLARLLGLVIDLEIERALLPDTVQSAPRTLALRPGGLSGLQLPMAESSPGTWFVLADQVDTGPHFVAAARVSPDPADPDRPPSRLKSLAEVTLEAADIDGAALKALHLAVTLSRATAADARKQVPLHQPTEIGVSALRSGGVALIERDRAAKLQQEFAGQWLGESAGRAWAAEELVRGYRLDVFDETTGVWRSLHQRRSTATAERFADGTLTRLDEGFVAISVAGAPTAPGTPPDPAGELYVHETLVSWDGWSLSAPRAGRPLAADSANAPTDIVPNTPFTSMRLNLSAQIVPGTLPRLRFGRRYRVRLREVDFAGNGPTVAEADQVLASGALAAPGLVSEDVVYRRMEPVGPPVVVPAQRFGEGASARRFVIRSDRETGPDTYAEGLNAERPGAAYRGHDDRHIAAPKVAFDLVEKHGLFDPVIGADAAPSDQVRAAYALATRESGRFDDPTAPDAEAVVIPAAGDRPPQQYVIRHAEQLELPYLPDPLALGVVLTGFPGGPLRLRFADDGGPAWPDLRPLRIRLSAGDGAPAWDPATRVLTVALPQATTTHVRIASILDDLDLMGVLTWCETELSAGDFEQVRASAVRNTCWLLTPWLDLEFVHAVQRPLTDPVLETVVSNSPTDATYTDLFGRVELHPGSTEKIDLCAQWAEVVDDPSRDEPGWITAPDYLDRPDPIWPQSRAQVFDLPVRDAAAHPDVHERSEPATLQGGRLLTFNTEGLRHQSRVTTPRPHEFGDTRYRQVSYTVVATTPFREDFPLDWTTDQPERFIAASNEVTVDVLSRARPAPPRLAYVVPTMGWEQTADETTVTSRRRGGGLRIWLERGWFSSGAGERLGVVVGASMVLVDEPTYPFVSFIAQDPIRSAADLPTMSTSTFRNGVPATRLRLAELTQDVDIVSFAPRWDAGSRRWFCDLYLDTEDAYFPFVRLALVRYQPQSLPRCEISSVVLADICQTLPDRVATLVRDPGDPLTATLSVAGPSYAAIAGILGERSDPAARGTLTAEIQRADPVITDPDLRWQPADVAATVLTATPGPDDVTTTWSGTVTVPADGGRYRVLLVEREHLAVDLETDPSELGSRVVYAASFDL